MGMITAENFTRVNNDTNGNPRYVIHFLAFLTAKEQSDISNKSRPFQAVNDMFREALNKARSIGGKKYTGKDFGGGIVLQSYNITATANQINELLKD